MRYDLFEFSKRFCIYTNGKTSLNFVQSFQLNFARIPDSNKFLDAFLSSNKLSPLSFLLKH